MKAVLLLATVVVVLASVPLSGSVFVSIADELPATLPPGTAYTAKSTGGPWHLASTWVQGGVPGPGSVVTIPAGVTVRIEHIENVPANAPKWVRVQGRLEVSNTVSTRFYVETIHVTPTGTFALGSSAAPLPIHLLAEIIFTSDGPIVRSWDKEQISRGLVAEGPVKVYGASRGVGYLGVTSDVPKNTQTMTTAGTPWNWRAGDEVVLTGTYFRRGRPSQEEVRRVSSIVPSSLTVDLPYSNDHLRVSTAGQTVPNLHIANLTRNVRFRSNSTAVGDRGHIILNHVDSEIQWAAFINLGRTDKSTKLDDFIVGATSTSKQDPALVNNRRGRYSLHVHKTGWGNSLTTPQTKIIGCVVNNAPGWGFVNHSGNVNFQQNVAYDFFGAGFVTEDGDELGTFTSNIAIKGRGTGEFATRKARINFQHPTRRQALADFAFMGDGFWFNGPAIRVSGAVANSCNGRGMIWHTTGAVRPSTATTTGTPAYPFGRYSFFPRNQISNVYSTTYPAAANLVPRTWKGNTNNAIIADLPILGCTNVQSYANFIGFHLRFNNHDSVAWYTEDPFNYDLQIEPVPGQSISSVPTRVRENISNLKLWNNEEAYAIRYASFANWTTVQAINRLDYDEVTASNDPSINPIYAAENFFVLNDMTFNGLTIDGWDVANFLAQITNNANGNPITSTGTNIVINSPQYRKYALTGTWDRRPNATPCALPTLNNPQVALNKQSATLSWNGSAGKYLIRYRIDGSQQWTYEETNASTKSLGIATTPSRNYSWQVMGGCSNTLSNWTARGAFHTF
jgi:hypothetical protein